MLFWVEIISKCIVLIRVINPLFRCKFLLLAAPEKIDLGIVFGSTGSSKLSFDQQKSFVIDLLKRFNIGASGTLPGVVTYGKDAKVVMNIGRILTREDAINLVNNIKDPGEGDSVHSALVAIQDFLFKPQNGARVGVPKILVLLLDKVPTKDGVLSNVIAELKAKGVKVIVISTRGDIDQTVYPKVDSLILPKNFPDLIRKMKPVITGILPGMYT